jgi:dTDP-4-amino-4,6-dideoxygalactose transaminase
VYTRMMSKETYKWMYEVEYVGNKYNGNSIMASLALVGLKYLEQGNAYRRQIAEWYDQAFKDNPKITLVKQTADMASARHLYQIVVEHRDEMLLYLNDLDIYPGVHYRDNTLYPMYKYANGTCPKAHAFSDKLLSLPMHLKLTHEDVLKITRAINEFTTLKK